MKGIRKCFGLLSVLSIMLGLSLSVFSEDSSALRHEYLTIPAYQSSYLFTGFSTSAFTTQPFTIRWNSDYSQGAPIPKRQIVMSSRYNSSSGKCTYYNRSWYPTQNSGYSIESYYSFPAVVYDYRTSLSNNTSCNYLSAFDSPLPQSDFNISSVPAFDLDSVPIDLNPDAAYQLRLLRHNLPYRYSYDHIELKGSATSSNGVVYNKSLKASDLYPTDGGGNPFIPNKFYELIIPFDRWKESVGGALTAGRNIEFKGTFYFPGLSSQEDFAFAPNFTTGGLFRIHYTYMNPDTPAYTSGNISCNLTRTYSQLDSSLTMNLDYSCPFEVPQDFSGGYFEYYLLIRADSSDKYIWDSTADWGWAGVYVVTDNDNTPGSPMSDDCTGGNCADNPGSAQPLADEMGGDGDWFDSLVNLFSFDILNPFAPLFQMFTNSDQCSQIPIIAGMLNAEDSTYCPWFDNSVRSVLTPVLSLSSMMLLFGFFVRWLNSSSGNLFEDSSHEEVSKVGGKWGRYPKGGK